MADPLSDRPNPDDSEQLWISLRVGDRQFAPEALETWGTDSVTLLFANAQVAEHLGAGDDAQLTVRSTRGTVHLRVAGSLERLEAYGRGLRCKLTFTDHAALTRQLAAAAGLFERRGNQRVPAARPGARLPESNRPTERSVKVRLDQRGATAHGELVDLSTGGLGAVFVDGRNLPAVGSTVLVELDLPTGHEPLVVTCRTADVDRSDDGIRVGLAFTSGPGRTTAGLEALVLEYILLRQRDLFSRDVA